MNSDQIAFYISTYSNGELDLKVYDEETFLRNEKYKSPGTNNILLLKCNTNFSEEAFSEKYILGEYVDNFNAVISPWKIYNLEIYDVLINYNYKFLREDSPEYDIIKLRDGIEEEDIFDKADLRIRLKTNHCLQNGVIVIKEKIRINKYKSFASQRVYLNQKWREAFSNLYKIILQSGNSNNDLSSLTSIK